MFTVGKSMYSIVTETLYVKVIALCDCRNKPTELNKATQVEIVTEGKIN